MDRCGIFVDAGYLIAEGAKYWVSPAAKRGDVRISYRELARRLCDRARKDCGLPILRVYWYDGAVDGVPTTDQQAIGRLPDLKLRLLSGGRQKGVDALVYRDLSVLSRERAIVTAYLVAGDEDLREGVCTAQELGVQVTLWGVGTANNQALTLKAEVDRCDRLDDLGDVFVPAAGSQLVLAREMASHPAGDEASVQATAEAFARSWMAATTPGDVGTFLPCVLGFRDHSMRSCCVPFRPNTAI